jgi:cytochrome c peroxidase
VLPSEPPPRESIKQFILNAEESIMKLLKSAVLILFGLGTNALAAEDLVKKAADAGLKPIPQKHAELLKLIDNPDNPITKDKLELGNKLYFDPRLSKSSLISCNTCHNLALGGVDGIPTAIGHRWEHNPHHLNSPTVYNSAFNVKQFWDGRSPDLEDQATGPIEAGPEMAMPTGLAIERISSIPEYVDSFRRIFPDQQDPVTLKNIGKVIGAFERMLITPSRFDAFMHGHNEALNAKEKEGLKTFIDKGCASCHTDVGIGGASMQKFPMVKPYKYADLGDFKGDADGMVKVPLLRNIAETAPYFHNGAVWDLNEAVKIMGETQMGITLTDQEANSIVAFLHSLTGKKPDVHYPMLPASTEKTPKPQDD